MNMRVAITQPNDPCVDITEELDAVPDGGRQLGYDLRAVGTKEPLDVCPMDRTLQGKRGEGRLGDRSIQLI